MRKDAGVDGDAQRISQLGWMIFLKIFDDRRRNMTAGGTTITLLYLRSYAGAIGLLILKE